MVLIFEQNRQNLKEMITVYLGQRMIR